MVIEMTKLFTNFASNGRGAQREQYRLFSLACLMSILIMTMGRVHAQGRACPGSDPKSSADASVESATCFSPEVNARIDAMNAGSAVDAISQPGEELATNPPPNSSTQWRPKSQAGTDVKINRFAPARQFDATSANQPNQIGMPGSLAAANATQPANVTTSDPFRELLKAQFKPENFLALLMQAQTYQAPAKKAVLQPRHQSAPKKSVKRVPAKPQQADKESRLIARIRQR